MSSYDAGYAMGQLIFGLGIPLLVLGGICWGVIAIIRAARKPAVALPTDPGILMRFGLVPGEGHGPIWQAFHPSGAPMMATITSMGVFALNYTVAQAPPVRLRPEGAVVTVGLMQTVTPGAVEPILEVTVSAPGHDPLYFGITQSGARALTAWAVPAP
jgi:hypothetical protein